MNIIKYTHNALTGSDCMIEESFKACMDDICGYALINGLKLHINSSKRDSIIVHGAIVQPAVMSNHLIGHAIDCNIEDGKAFLNSTIMAGELMGNVLKFIESVRAHKILRWGGDFKTRDVVHFDDGLNVHNPDLWHELYNSQTNSNC